VISWIGSIPPSQFGGLAHLVGNAVESALKMFEEVVKRLLAAGMPTGPGTLLNFEQALHHDVARSCLDPIVAAVIQAAHGAPAVVERATMLVGAYADLRLQKTAQPVAVTLLGGSTAEIFTPYFLQRPRCKPGRKRGRGRRGKEGNGIYPRLAALGIHFRVSPALAGEVARQVALGTVEQSMDALAARGIKLDRKTVSRLTQRLAERGLAHRDWLEKHAQPHPNGWARGTRLVIGVDGGRLRTRINRKGAPRANGYRGFDAPWREPKVFVIYSIDNQGRRVKGSALHYDATLQDADRVFGILAAVLISIGAGHAAEWIVVGDGADWIWDRLQLLIEKVGFDANRVTEVLDFYHASEHLHEIATCVRGWTEGQKKAWFHRMRHLMRHGQIDKVLADVRRLCVGRNAKHIRRELTYFENRRHRLDYVSFTERGIPLGSGAVESAVRRVVNLRLKGNGIFWTESNAEGILHLRAHVLAGRWSEFVTCVLDHEVFWATNSGSASELRRAA
jgi:hypothetical protein